MPKGRWWCSRKTVSPTARPDPAKFSKLRNFCELVAGRWRKLIDSIEIDNEPDAMFWDLHLPLDVAASAYEGIVGSCAAGVRAVAGPGEITLVGLSLNGQGYWKSKGGNLTFGQKVLSNKSVANTLSALSVHPYARAHWIPETSMSWGPAGWSMPNATDDGPGLEGRLNLTVKMMEVAGMKPRLWPTEFGYQLLANSSVSGWAAHTHAACVAQSLLLMRGQAAVERFFFFLASDGASSVPYGMWGSDAPRPALAAFAAAAQFTDAPRFDTGYVVDLGNTGVSALHFRATQGSTDTLAIWIECGKPQCTTLTTIELSLIGVAVRNGFGRVQPAARFNASALPSYIAFPAPNLAPLAAQLRAQFDTSLTSALKTDDATVPSTLVGVHYFAGWYPGPWSHWLYPTEPLAQRKSWVPDYPGRIPLGGNYTTDLSTVEADLIAASAYGVDFFEVLWSDPAVVGGGSSCDGGHDPADPNMRPCVDIGLAWMLNSSIWPELKGGLRFSVSYSTDFDSAKTPAQGMFVGEAGQKKWESFCATWIRAMSHHRYLRVDGRPVFKILGPSNFLGAQCAGNATLSQQRIDEFRALAQAAGGSH